MKLRTVNMTEPLKDIKTNIITGFLGVGKSTAILDLLEQKPEKERWAVLVNEFGEIGIDGGLFANHQDPNIFIREVPGGCMCCATGLPMQIAMSMLLARARPERLIIEPTGLGHPVEVMSVLAADHFHELLDLRSTLTLVDARVINDERYTSHDTFNQQLDIADIVVASKRDLYGKDDFKRLEEYLSGRNLTPKRQLVSAAARSPRYVMALWRSQCLARKTNNAETAYTERHTRRRATELSTRRVHMLEQ